MINATQTTIGPYMLSKSFPLRSSIMRLRAVYTHQPQPCDGQPWSLGFVEEGYRTPAAAAITV